MKSKVYILLDRSGSMASNWEETIGSINAYVDALAKDMHVHIAAFDSSGFQVGVSYETLRDGVVKDQSPIAIDEILPRGGTPLNDASAKIIDLALAEGFDKTVLVFMTDGWENASKEYSTEAIKGKIKIVTDKGWEAVYLGANFDQVNKQAASYGVGQTKFVNMAHGNMSATMSSLADKTMGYAGALGPSGPIGFTETEQKEAAKEAA